MARNGSVWKTADASEESVCTVVLPNGTSKRVQPSDPFAETVLQIAKTAGLSKFTVFVDGQKLNSSEAPTDFDGLTEVEIKKYDEGA
jgi:predicted carbohydrate-binding protein with CBM5 and CBM33 domain